MNYVRTKNVCDKHSFLSDGLGSSTENPMVESK
jgi:hypothetical protein